MKRLVLLAFITALLIWNFEIYPQWEDQAATHVTINSIVENPNNYVGRRIAVTGYVEGRISFLGASAFRLNAGGLEFIDVAGFTNPPEPGDRVTVTGRLSLVKSLNGFDMPVIYVN